MKNIPEMMKILKYSLLGLALAVQGHSVAQENPSHQLVVEAAESFVRNNIPQTDDSIITVEANSIDPRLNIPVCPLPLEVSNSSGTLMQSNVTVKVSCPSNNWFIYTVVNVNEVQPVVVPNTALSPGSVLTADDLDVVQVDKKRLRGSTYTSVESLIGARLKRRSRPNQPITPNMLCFVCKGDSIVIMAEVSGMKIKTSGIAEQDGNIGDTILVKNRRSKKVIDAKVVSVNQVQVHI
ncbi:flagellar basal body P-ring formation protein FlgA [Paraneptunicella aestuarii]|uniref:flagellar basal body P-ring formation chaperone FlgA n=1 Tax=Paraneptunicella aestuarii TaxID=2831148 RepID=UPI001E3657F0|nr:flagellar basal body P-ring formation chaperone FlgA [Paraneptunicella aestuarii]UAA39470.1 flagellar basal body P-ring formation protein FlgA [Paraneptunicella aestuarii]